MPNSQERKWAVFLDRDGTVIEERRYISDPHDVVLLPTAADAISKLNARGIPVIVVTNQAGVARGYFSLDQVREIHRRLDLLLRDAGAVVDGYYVCPHHPTAGVNEFGRECNCRKPKPGMLLNAASDKLLDLERSFMIGDKELDLQAGRAAGCTSMLVLTGYGRDSLDAVKQGDPNAGVHETLGDAVRFILGEAKRMHDGPG